MPDWLTEPGDTLVAIIRQIVHEEVSRVIFEMNRATTTPVAKAARPVAADPLWGHLEAEHGHVVSGLGPSDLAHWLDRHRNKLHGPRRPAGAVNHTHDWDTEFVVPGADPICGAVEGQRVCLKPRHRGRHKFTMKPHEAPARPWEPIEETTIKSGTRNYVIAVGNPVKVQGLGRAGAAGDGYKVVSMERHTETGKINVEVIKTGKGQRSRVVELSRIVYKRPRKEAQ